jgi:hypothetical protein
MTQTASDWDRERDPSSAVSHRSIVMNKEPRRSRFLAGDLISEKAVRSVFGRRGGDTPQSAPIEPANGLSAKPKAPNGSTSASGRPLRRWSVAELIARAAAAPRAGNIGHC